MEPIEKNPMFARNTHAKGNTVYGIWSDKNGNAYAAGEGGTIFHWKKNEEGRRGTVTAEIVDPDVDFYDIYGFHNKILFAVGTRGKIYCKDLSIPNGIWIEWEPAKNKTKEMWLESAWGRSPQEMYFAGDDGALFFYNGTTFSQIPKQSNNRLYSLGGKIDIPLSNTYAVGSFGTVIEMQFQTSNPTIYPTPFISKIFTAYDTTPYDHYLIHPDEQEEAARNASSNTDSSAQNTATLAYKQYTGITNDFYGIESIPDTSNYYLCGRDGGIYKFNGKEITTESAFTLQPKFEKLFGVDIINASNQTEAVFVGWKGYSLHKKGDLWTEYALGNNSYMEGVVYAGDGLYVAAGFHGRVMVFDSQVRAWHTEQAGRAEKIYTTALTSYGYVSGSDTGGLVYGPSTRAGNPIHYMKPFTYRVSLPIKTASGNEFIIAGDGGVLQKAQFSHDHPIEISPITMNGLGERNIMSVSWDENFAYFAGHYQDDKNKTPVFFRYDRNQIDTITLEDYSIYLKKYDKQIYGVSFSGPNVFYFWGHRLDVEKVELNMITRIPIRKKIIKDYTIDLFFGNFGHTYVSIKDSIYKINTNDDMESFIDLESHWISKGETLSYGMVTDVKGTLFLGGSKGTILCIKNNIVSVYHCGAYNAVYSIALLGKRFVAGLARGRVVSGDLYGPNEKNKYFSSISAPTYSVITALNTSTICIAGDSGTIGLFVNDAQGNPSTQLLTDKRTECYGDILCADTFEGGALLAGCDFICFVPSETKNDEDITYFPVPRDQHIIFTTLAVLKQDNNDFCYLGTSSGDVYQIPLLQLINNGQIVLSNIDTYKIISKLPHSIIDIQIKTDKLVAVLENGKIIDTNLETNLSNCTHEFSLQYLRRPIASNRNNQNGLWVSGYQNFLACINGPRQEIHTLPMTIYTISMHGNVREHGNSGQNEYWVSGSSGTLLVYSSNEWYLIESGTGNHLYSAIANENHVVIIGEYGAVRYAKRDYIDNKIPKKNSQDDNMLHLWKDKSTRTQTRPRPPASEEEYKGYKNCK